jgi:hypothetical protein
MNKLWPNPSGLVALLMTSEAFAGALEEGWDWRGKDWDGQLDIRVRNTGPSTVCLEVHYAIYSGILGVFQ